MPNEAILSRDLSHQNGTDRESPDSGQGAAEPDHEIPHPGGQG